MNSTLNSIASLFRFLHVYLMQSNNCGWKAHTFVKSSSSFFIIVKVLFLLHGQTVFIPHWKNEHGKKCVLAQLSKRGKLLLACTWEKKRNKSHIKLIQRTHNNTHSTAQPQSTCNRHNSLIEFKIYVFGRAFDNREICNVWGGMRIWAQTNTNTKLTTTTILVCTHKRMQSPCLCVRECVCVSVEISTSSLFRIIFCFISSVFLRLLCVLAWLVFFIQYIFFMASKSKNIACVKCWPVLANSYCCCCCSWWNKMYGVWAVHWHGRGARAGANVQKKEGNDRSDR